MHGRDRDRASTTPTTGSSRGCRPLLFRCVDEVAERESGDPEERELGERDHPAVGREEDQARGRDPEEQGLR